MSAGGWSGDELTQAAVLVGQCLERYPPDGGDKSVGGGVRLDGKLVRTWDSDGVHHEAVLTRSPVVAIESFA
jgi:hypothetical protein